MAKKQYEALVERFSALAKEKPDQLMAEIASLVSNAFLDGLQQNDNIKPAPEKNPFYPLQGSRAGVFENDLRAELYVKNKHLKL